MKKVEKKDLRRREKTFQEKMQKGP